MQLSLDQKYAVYYPPKTQLLKWVGNKQRFAGEITKYFPVKFNTFIEPFLGSGAIMATVAPKKGLGTDVFKPLMEIWNKLADNPEELIKWYEVRRNRLEFEDKIDVYNDIRDSFNSHPKGADFLFLTRACYGGIVRFRKADGYMSTPCGVHKPISSDGFKKRVYEWYHRLHNVSFEQMDFRDAFDNAKPGDMIYCDPPYSHSQKILYGAQEFMLEDLFEKIENAVSKNIKVALSIDGSKKSGNYLCDLPIPKNLFKQEIFISIGRSMLRRFQLEGKDLKQEEVSDRLLLTY